MKMGKSIYPSLLLIGMGHATNKQKKRIIFYSVDVKGNEGTSWYAMILEIRVRKFGDEINSSKTFCLLQWLWSAEDLSKEGKPGLNW